MTLDDKAVLRGRVPTALFFPWLEGCGGTAWVGQTILFGFPLALVQSRH